jgi:hypothetical protein
MTATYQQILSDPALGAAVIALSLSPDTPAPLQGAPVVVLCDYSAAMPNGVVLPLSIQVTTPDGRLIVDRQITHVLAESFDFIPDIGGSHLARVAELNHNRWFGALEIIVTGEAATS